MAFIDNETVSANWHIVGCMPAICQGVFT